MKSVTAGNQKGIENAPSFMALEYVNKIIDMANNFVGLRVSCY
jgi:hypothetical protein